MQKKKHPKMGLLGLGLDDAEGHVRQTRGENFYLCGGSEETHGIMQEQCIHFNEKLKSRGKNLEDLNPDEFLDIADDCEML